MNINNLIIIDNIVKIWKRRNTFHYVHLNPGPYLLLLVFIVFFLLFFGYIFELNTKYLFIYSIFGLYISSLWFFDIIYEKVYEGFHTKIVQSIY
jgi:hypothetical protein